MSVTRAATPTTIPIMRPFLGEEEATAAAEAVRSGWVAQGPRVAAFEQAFAARTNTSQAIAVSNCTTALHLAMVLAEVGPGDHVVVPSFSFIATANVARYVGAVPVFADVELSTGNLTVDTIAAAHTPQTKAVIVVHQGGTPADVASIHAWCAPRGIAVVEDAACAIGAELYGQPIGSHSELVCFSFHPRKVITTGEGGMITTTSDALATRARRLREHGMSVSAAERHAADRVVLEEYLEVGFNYRMTDIQAAVGMVQLERLDQIVARRRFLAERYRQALSDIDGIVMVDDPSYGRSNFQSFWVLLPDDFPISRNDLMAAMLTEGISTRRGIMAAHLEPAYRPLAEDAASPPRSSLANTERLTHSSVILPIFHDLTEADHDRVIAAFRAAAGARPSRA